LEGFLVEIAGDVQHLLPMPRRVLRDS